MSPGQVRGEWGNGGGPSGPVERGALTARAVSSTP